MKTRVPARSILHPAHSRAMALTLILLLAVTAGVGATDSTPQATYTMVPCAVAAWSNPSIVAADGDTPGTVVARVDDCDGGTIADGFLVDFSTDFGEFLGGGQTAQVTTVGGFAQAQIVASSEGIATVTVQVNGYSDQAGFTFTEPYIDDLHTLDYHLGANPETLDPSLATDASSITVIEQLFAGLVRLNPETGVALPDLATGWTVSADSRVYTFDLRNDAFWSDGLPVTAHDVEFGFKQSLEPGRASGYAFLL